MGPAHRPAPAWEHGFLEASGGVRLHYVTQGTGPLLLFVHGFPDYWYGWRHQISEFARDHRVVAIDQRGYNDSDKPAGRGAYRTDDLVADLVCVIDQLGGGRATLVGHDWGGAVSWAFAHRHEEMLERLVICNMPHPGIFLKKVTRPPQLFRSWYIFFFQLPRLPEVALTRDHAAAIGAIFREAAQRAPEEINESDIQGYRDAFLKPGVATAALNYYRNLGGRAGGGFAPLRVPTLLIWGEQDTALGRELTDGTDRFVRNLTSHFVSDAGHFVQQERPVAVNAAIRAFIKPPPAAARNSRTRPRS